LEARPLVVGGEEYIIVRVRAGSAGVGYLDDLIVGVAIWNGAGPGCCGIFSCMYFYIEVGGSERAYLEHTLLKGAKQRGAMR
jgi:hypothetical protein